MIETDTPQAADETGSLSAEPPSVLVVDRSPRGWLVTTLPPALILVSALAITSHQLRPHPPIYAPRSPEKATVPRISLAPSSTVDPGRIAARVVVDEPRPVVDEPRPAAGPAVVSVESDQEVQRPPDKEDEGERVGEEPPVAAVVRVEADAEQKDGSEASEEGIEQPPAAQIVWDDIEAEAREARQRKLENQALRGEVFARKEADARERLMRARLTAANDRGQFLSDLNTLIRRHGRKAGPYISELVGLYGRSMPPELQEAASKVRSRMEASRTSAEARIKAYRQLGLPETCILDELSQQLLPSIGTRKGPRNRDEVLYFASRILLSVPLDRSASSATSPR